VQSHSLVLQAKVSDFTAGCCARLNNAPRGIFNYFLLQFKTSLRNRFGAFALITFCPTSVKLITV
jgi:hypothetical protein